MGASTTGQSSPRSSSSAGSPRRSSAGREPLQRERRKARRAELGIGRLHFTALQLVPTRQKPAQFLLQVGGGDDGLRGRRGVSLLEHVEEGRERRVNLREVRRRGRRAGRAWTSVAFERGGTLVERGERVRCGGRESGSRAKVFYLRAKFFYLVKRVEARGHPGGCLRGERELLFESEARSLDARVEQDCERARESAARDRELDGVVAGHDGGAERVARRVHVVRGDRVIVALRLRLC